MSDADFTIGKESERKLVPLLTSLLNRVIEISHDEYADMPDLPDRLAAFYALTAPRITVEQYLERIFHYSRCSPSCLVMAMIYIERMLANEPQMGLCLLNVHRVIITAVMTAAKYLDDIHYSNEFWAQIGGVSLPEMNRLELDFLANVNFDLYVTPELFREYYDILMSVGGVDSYIARMTEAAAGPMAVEDLSREELAKRGGFGGRRGSADPRNAMELNTFAACC